MRTDAEHPLAGQRILVPPARAALNPLDRMLAHQGAECVVFPSLVAERPPETADLDLAVDAFGRYEWVLFVGQLGVQHLLERAAARGRSPLDEPRGRLASVGHGAFKLLRELGHAPDWAPILHTPAGIANGMGELTGRLVLLVREAHASRALPDELSARGARVTAITGHCIRPVLDVGAARETFSRRLDVLALANPTALRIFCEASAGLGLDLERCLAGVTIAAVGEATAGAARRRGLAPDLVAGGRLKLLVRSLTGLFAGAARS